MRMNTNDLTTPIANKGDSDAKWKISAFISLAHHNDDMDDFTSVDLYTQGQYVYYERTHTICSDHYCTTFRFNKDRIGDVLLHLAENPNDLEGYIRRIKGCEIVKQERY